MGFDLDKFNGAKLSDRTDVVLVPEFKEFFDDPEKPEWVVKALDGLEMAEARQAKDQNRSIETVLAGLMSSQAEDKVQAVKDALGVASETAPDDYVWRVAVLRLGSVDPKIDEAQAVRVAKANGYVFQKLTNRIIQLSAMGQRLGE